MYVGDPAEEICGEWFKVGEECETVWVDDPVEPEDPPNDPCLDESGFYICDPENPDPGVPIIDCAGVEGGSAYMADCGCIGGTTGITACPTKPTDSVIKKFCDNLTAAQKTIIENAVNEFKNYDCATKYMYKHFDDTNKTFEFCIGAESGSATYNSATKSFNFTSNAAASNMSLMEHEFMHAFQDDTYAGGIGQYGLNTSTGVPNAGFVDIEFEQAVMNDMINYGNNFVLLGATPQQQLDYQNWINEVTNNGTTYPKINPNGTITELAAYNTFISKYHSFLSIYNGVSVNSSTALNLSPQALIKLFNNINRNCP